MTHTPGTWTADLKDTNEHMGFSITNELGKYIATVYANFVSSDRSIPMSELPINRESVDNARLIAAAPELLEALEELLHDDGSTVIALGNNMYTTPREMAEKAINKAKGEIK
jgi:hypothetical protein